MNNIHNRLNDRGQATVEIILLMNAVVVMVFIIINIFFITYNQLVVMESANEGARYAGLLSSNSTSNRNRIKLCSDYLLDILNQKLRNASCEKPEVIFSGGMVRVKASCKYKFYFPIIDSIIDTNIALEHVSIHHIAENF